MKVVLHYHVACQLLGSSRVLYASTTLTLEGLLSQVHFQPQKLWLWTTVTFLTYLLFYFAHLNRNFCLKIFFSSFTECSLKEIIIDEDYNIIYISAIIFKLLNSLLIGLTVHMRLQNSNKHSLQ